nr:RNA-directed DNA polymerase, eukaryota [Tanacetum cinerariifolium]
LSYLGGLWVMIELNIEETKMKLLQHTGVNSWFEELKPASQEFVCNERIMWVDIEGISLHLWSSSTFSRIGMKWGTVMDIEESHGSSFARKRLCIKTSMAVEESDVEEVSGTIFEVSPQAPHVDVHKVNEKANSHHLDDPFASHQDPIHSNSAHLEVNQDEPPIAKGSSLKSYTKASYFSQASQGNDSSADSSIHVSSRSTPKGGSILEVLGGMIKVGRSMGYDMEGCSKDIEQIIRLQGEADGIK